MTSEDNKTQESLEDEIERLKEMIKQGKVPGVKVIKINRAYSTKMAEECEPGPAGPICPPVPVGPPPAG